MATPILVTTTEQIPGKHYQVIGEVFGLTTQSKNVLRNMGAALKNVVGGEIRDYTKMLDEARNIAVDRLRQNAEKLGADAVVMMRFDSGSIGTDMQSVAAYGTAVKFVEADSAQPQQL
ncbi:heavy metal-binding domain-containing protein [Levilactobacillus namurensis]|uniref:heavy metal-binding domain-containing protein n=1 Tax=Levilactobacillus namurensis TaxID=380393 RepID=UPI001DF8E29C|nr:heavy metal-binding domain-containing protein [Levilactobacillus namurensis]HJE44373.1 heavy metal-binding domain-containing protein [Levilactobacillus namurensis]